MTNEPSDKSALRFTPPSSVDTVARDLLGEKLKAIEEHVDKDVIVLYGPIQSGVDVGIREAVERIENHRDTALFIVDTEGGSVEVVERIVDVLRNRYKEVHFAVPDKAMSAGTVLVLSGDSILMDSFSRLGPIDPQILSPDRSRYISGLSYLSQYEELKKKGPEITQAEMILLQKLDLAELDMYRLAKDLTIDLLKKWLVQYKFRNWKETEDQKIAVNDKMREERANKIAESLNDQQRWGSHGRGISSKVLRDELELKIEDLEQDPKQWQLIREHFWFLMDYCNRNGFRNFIQSKNLI